MVSVRVEGFPDDLRAKGEAELVQVLEAFGALEQASDEKLPKTLDCIDEVVVTPRFEEAVRERLRNEYGEAGEAYRAARHGILAAGKTLRRVQDGQIRFAILLNSESMGGWQESHKAWRLSTLCHEFFHALKWKVRFDESGPERPRDTWRPDDYYATIIEVASEEYSVDKLTNSFLRFTCTDAQGKPFELHRELVALGWDYLNTAIEMLDGMREYFADSVSSFMLYRSDIQTLSDQALSYIIDVGTVLAHFAATRDDLVSWEDDEATLRKCDGYSRFVADAWPAIHRFWKLPADTRDAEFDEARRDAEQAVQSIYRRCGLQLSPRGEGTYIGVTFPSTLLPN